MFDLYVPGFVWVCGTILLFIREIRQWTDMMIDYTEFIVEYEHKCKIEAEDKDVPESVKHMFS